MWLMAVDYSSGSLPVLQSIKRAGLYLLLAGQLMPMIDFSIVNVALDEISHSFDATKIELVLVVSTYGLAFALCLAMGGRLGDNCGRRRIFGLGIVVFSVASSLCGIARSVPLLLTARGLQGAAA